MFIGDSILEAIDWVQDKLMTTRPLAERTLFGLLRDKKANETNLGFIIEEVEEEELTKRHIKAAQGQNGGYRFHRSRTFSKKRHPLTEKHVFIQKVHHMERLEHAKYFNSDVDLDDYVDDVDDESADQ